MGEYQRPILYRFEYPLIALALALVALAAVVIAPMTVSAQGCVGDPCYTPTATGTASPVPTVGAGTPTHVAMPPEVPFPMPDFNHPTSIPAMECPDVPGPLNPTIEPLPSPITMPSVGIAYSDTIDLLTIETSISLSYTTPATFAGGSGSVTGTSIYTGLDGLIQAGQGVYSDVLSYTGYISGEATAVQGTDTFTIATAPAWYAPDLPRDWANVGWTFELMDSDMYSVKRYSLNTWAIIFGYTAALPIKLAKSLYELFAFFGPFGLFLIWLLVVMFPTVMGFRIFRFLLEAIIKGINFILTILDWLWKLWEAIPFVN
jgi:hypothetical protein